jgi:hypothetical protein
VDELLALYALDALDPAERDLVERELDGNPGVRAEVDSLRETVALLGVNTATAPEGLWTRIERAIGADSPGREARVHAPTRGGRPRARAIALAAAAALVVAMLGVEVVRERQRVDRLAAQIERDPIERAALDAMHAPDSHVVELASSDRARSAHVVMQADGTGYLMTSNLPRLPPNRTYQMWARIERNGAPTMVSLSTLGRDAGPARFHVSDGVVGLEITEEAAPGSPVPGHPPIVEARLSGA